MVQRKGQTGSGSVSRGAPSCIIEDILGQTLGFVLSYRHARRMWGALHGHKVFRMAWSSGCDKRVKEIQAVRSRIYIHVFFMLHSCVISVPSDKTA